MLEDMDGLDLLNEIRERRPDQTVIMTTAVRSTRAAVQAMKLGAYDYLTKPFEPEEIRIVVARAIEEHRMRSELYRLRAAVDTGSPFREIAGHSPQMQRVFQTMMQVKDTDSTVIIYGESGTGKELVARALHFGSRRKEGAFMPVHCAAISRELLESELFGHERGAFTGATRAKKGMFEEADGGTLFLDEIGEMELAMQAKLLRAIQEREIRHVGATTPIRVNVRLIAATNRDLHKEVSEGRFREDLYYRINVVPVEMPRLSERAGDVPLLVRVFLDKVSKRLGVDPPPVEPEVLEVLEEYDWPGNVRQLENTIERMLVLAAGDPLGVDHLPPGIVAAVRGVDATPQPSSVGGRKETGDAHATAADWLAEGKTLSDMTEQVEREAIRHALDRAEGRITEAARILGTTRRILRYKMDKLGLESES
jgi:DNA-binding NtrC family response regulator